MVRARGASMESTSILELCKGEMKGTHPLEKMTVRLFKLSAEWGLEVDKDVLSRKSCLRGVLACISGS